MSALLTEQFVIRYLCCIFLLHYLHWRDTANLKSKTLLIHMHRKEMLDHNFLALEGLHAFQIFLMDAADPEGKLFLVQKGQQGLEYYVEHHDGSLLILTNVNGAMNNCLMTAPVKSPSKRSAH